MTLDDSNKYTIDNRITNTRYSYLSCDLPIEIRPITLTRVYPDSDFYAQLDLMRESVFDINAAAVAPSILEFKHDFVFHSDLRGKQVRIRVSGMDKYSNIIGDSLTIDVNVK